jgi:thiamine-monophosphate kinase
MKAFGEFDFIGSIREMVHSLPENGFEGIGDDCAILPIGNDDALVFTTDMLNEGIHFLTDKSTAYQIGYKSLMVNVSDVAAMGARPIATLLSIALPKECFGAWSNAFMAGYRDASARCNVALVGGDTTKSEAGVSVSVTAIGRAPMSNIKRRSAAKVGDDIFVTSALGASSAGLRDVLSGRVDSLCAKIHLQPNAEVESGIWLGEQESVRAMMDLSDGIASDLLHITEESSVGASIFENLIPVAEGATFANAIGGGEDYRLLFTVRRDSSQRLMQDFRARFGTPIYKIGEITASSDVILQCADGTLKPLSSLGGFRHF